MDSTDRERGESDDAREPVKVVGISTEVVDIEAAPESIDDRWRPAYVAQSAWLEHGLFARWIVATTRPRALVELGTHYGYSYFAFCETALEQGIELHAHALDTWQGDDQAGFYGDDVYEQVDAVNEAGYASFSTLHRGYFSDFVGSFDAGTVDLLHIDGRHGYDDVKEDFESWLPTLSSRGVVMFHDIAETQPGFGVWQLWAELRERYPSFEFAHGHGLGVLAVGPDVPGAVRDLVDADEERRARVRRHFERWGAAISNEVEVERLGRELAVKSDQFVEQAATIASLNEQIHELQRQNDALTSTLSWRVTAPLRKLRGRP